MTLNINKLEEKGNIKQNNGTHADFYLASSKNVNKLKETGNIKRRNKISLE